MRLFSYVVDHDLGSSPNPFGGICTLCQCKFRKTRKSHRNVLELAEEKDWVVGLGGTSKKSSGPGTILFAMEVTKKISLREYCLDPRYRQRHDAKKTPSDQSWRKALISKHFYYFGRNAVLIPAQFRKEIQVGRGFRNKFSDEFIKAFIGWLKKRKRGRRGLPCVWDDGAEPTHAKNSSHPQHPKKRHACC